MQMELRNYERQELIQISLKRQRALMIRDGEKDHMYISMRLAEKSPQEH
jgi:hypothetical protein